MSDVPAEIPGDRHYGFTDAIISAWEKEPEAARPFWGDDGLPDLDYGLLGKMLSVPTRCGEPVTRGRYAGAVEMWVAHELRMKF